MNKIAPRASWWILCFLGISAIVSLFYWGTRTTDIQESHHNEVKAILHETGQDVKEIKQDEKASFGRMDTYFFESKMWQKKYEDLLLKNQQAQITNELKYDTIYRNIDAADIDSIDSLLTKFLEDAKRFEW